MKLDTLYPAFRFLSCRPMCRSAEVLSRLVMTGATNAHRYNMDRNGEGWLIRQVAKSLPGKTVIDIGANAGNWSARVLDEAPGVNIYAVEMIPKFAESLRARFGDRVTVIECAISDSASKKTAYQVGNGGRFDLRNTQKAYSAVEVETRTGDTIVAEHGIDNIGLIKIDVDGYDVPAIRGLGGTIARDRPIVQFEYSNLYIDSRHFLKDAYDFFESLNYRVGRLMPRRIDFSSYRRSAEVFLTSNFVAAPSSSGL